MVRRKTMSRFRWYVRLHASRVMRCIKQYSVVMPNPIYGDFSTSDDIYKIGQIFDSLFEMGVLTEKEFYGSHGVGNNLSWRVQKRLRSLCKNGVLKSDMRAYPEIPEQMRYCFDPGFEPDDYPDDMEM